MLCPNLQEELELTQNRTNTLKKTQNLSTYNDQLLNSVGKTVLTHFNTLSVLKTNECYDSTDFVKILQRLSLSLKLQNVFQKYCLNL